MRFLSKYDIEQISERVLKAYWRLPESKTVPYRIQPDILLTRLLGLTIDHRHLSEDGLTLGLTSYEEVGVEVFGNEQEEMYFLDGSTVLIEENLLDQDKIGRYDFTVVHEGCHHILNLLFPGEYSGGVNARRVLKYRAFAPKGQERNWEEWQVDNMTSMILMPKELLFQNMRICGINAPIPMLNRIWRTADFSKFSRLSEMMGVSKQALAIRMKQFGYIEKDYLKNPNEILNIYNEEDNNGRTYY